MRVSWRYLMWLFAPTVCAQVTAVQDIGDPSSQELSLLGWTSGVRVAYCSDAPIEKLSEPFKISLVKQLNAFCGKKPSNCMLKKPVVFIPEDVMLLEGFPRRDYGAVQFRFVVHLPHGAQTTTKLREPLLTSEVLSDLFGKRAQHMQKSLNWTFLSYERFPKYDAITEFMNKALIPIGFILLFLMFFLAWWSSNLSKSIGGSELWSVSGSSGGKNAALRFTKRTHNKRKRRTMEIIEAQKLQETKDAESEKFDQKSEVNGRATKMTMKFKGTSERKSREILLDVPELAKEAKPSDAQFQYEKEQQDSNLQTIPEIVVVPAGCSGSSSELRSTTTNLTPSAPGVLSTRSSLATPSSRRSSSSRRLSSFEEVMKEKRRRKTRAGLFSAKREPGRWKSTSMALGGFGGGK